ncbi:uncharacterized protein LOC135163010 [Diachasmimorpha longicaudata]|uniref:uncharacterized protein LOC135163010 n=1 Tax=Diachasmimorpha longicaudata TaxID=58733 RepID=UPI0030B87298
MNKRTSGSFGGQNGDDSGIFDHDRNPGGASAHSESRKRISISEYKQRGKKPEEVALKIAASTLNNNDINFKIAPNPSSSVPQPMPKVAQTNGQIVFNSIEDYYAHVYCLSRQGQLPILPQMQGHLHPQNNAPIPQPLGATYPYWGQPSQPPLTKPIESRIPRVNDWSDTNNRVESSNPSYQVPMHNGESPTSRFHAPAPQEKTPKMTPASALNDPNEATSYREWRKRKYGTEDAPTPTNSNASKFRKADNWKDKGGSRNDRRSRQGPKKQDDWGTSGASSRTLDSWDNDSAKPQSSENLESWDDDAPAPTPASSGLALESWDDGPAPAPNTDLLSNLENWDDDTPAPVANTNLDNLENWDDGDAAPEPSAALPSVSWGNGSAGGPAAATNAVQNGLESWDDGEAPPVPSTDWGQPSAPPPSSKPIQDGLESWDDDTPAPQVSKEVLNAWTNNIPLQANARSNSWNSDNQNSRNNEWDSNRPQRNFRDNKNNGNRFKNGGDQRSRSGSRDYRGDSRSSDTSDSGYSNRQGYRGNRGRPRSGSRDSGNWGRNDSRDRSDNRSWNKRNNFGGNNNDRRNSRSSWGQPEPPPELPSIETVGESWDDDAAPPQPSKEFAASWGGQTHDEAQNPCGNSFGPSSSGNWSAPIIASAPIAAGLESWDDDVAPPEARQHPEAEPSAAGENATSKMSDMVRALCTTCTFEIIHRCKFERDPSTSEELKPGELFTCVCGMAFLHERDCINKVGENYAPITMETSLMKQVGRTHVYLCKVCDFKFIIENLKDGSHFFKQMTTKKGNKIRQGTAINDPVGLEAFTFHIEKINSIACLGVGAAVLDASFKHKMASTCQCNQGCCTVYHECAAYSGLLEEGETI